ncbi:MAG: glycosyltransferase [Actinomycetota bacterium]|nr:glycosyltransferase [Actinomycetota bacterium]
MPVIDMTLTLVVPVFNEEIRVSESFDALFDYVADWNWGSRLVFVDDGSTDRTVAVLREKIESKDLNFASVIERPHLGKGASVRWGLKTAGTDIAAFCDVDLATPLDELDRIIQRSVEIEGLAIGSRSIPGSNVVQRESIKREIAGRAFNRLVQILACPGIYDTQCGAKAAPVGVWRLVLNDSVEDGFAWDVEVVSRALYEGIKVSEMPIRWSHDNRSRVNVLSDGLKMTRAIFRMRSQQIIRRDLRSGTRSTEIL